ncbi:hypothetical protein GPALN_013006 [Globodera pallida]|nr:hypothetical protein GPALN_013006 [Globodera pallida]
MPKSPFNNGRRRPPLSHANSSSAASEWFRHKFGAAIQLSERREKESGRKQKAHCYSDVKKKLEECLTARRHEERERRYSFYNAENEIFEEPNDEDEEEEFDDENEEKGVEDGKEEKCEELEQEREKELDVWDDLEHEKEGFEEKKKWEGDKEVGEGLKENGEQSEEEDGEEEEEELTDEEELAEENEEEFEEENVQGLEDGKEKKGRGTIGRRKEEDGEEEEDEFEDEKEQEFEDGNDDKEVKKQLEEEKEKDGEEEEVELENKKQRKGLEDVALKRRLNDLFDDEASLSGDDVGSDSDNENHEGLDEYEAEEGDLDQLPDDEEIRENLVRQYLKHQNDTSDRQLLKLQEAFFADSDLHGQGGSGDRSFRFRMHVDANMDWAKLLGSIDGEDDGGEEDGEERQADKERHERRLLMMKWREEEGRKRRTRKRHRTQEDDEEDGRATGGGGADADAEVDEMAIVEPLDAPLFALGEKVLWTTTNKDANASPIASSSSSRPSFVPIPAFPSSTSVQTLSSVALLTPPPKRRDSLLPNLSSATASVGTECAIVSHSMGLHVKNL